ncbi:TIGR00725 family protein [Candidatus Aerophobetes bacterium]|uniref:TIGR00725 family protein n=1 Tax=Aerophobetes bacterium TaxID=2030807 RepID=A0A662D020_UNCAE|nr:MAG: TIGR00725 family protein [Candidatus Aerophobetes bacterium]
MRRLIAVSGSNGSDETLTDFALKSAEEVGYYIAKEGGVLVCGGRGGIMEAAAKGAKRAGGITLGILPGHKEEANEFIDIAIPTHLGYFRNYILISSADAVIGIAGRWGTLNEISLALNVGKPTVILKGSGGWADILSNEELLKSFKRKPYVASSAKEAVGIAFSKILKST